MGKVMVIVESDTVSTGDLEKALKSPNVLMDEDELSDKVDGEVRIYIVPSDED